MNERAIAELLGNTRCPEALACPAYFDQITELVTHGDELSSLHGSPEEDQLDRAVV